MLRLVGLNNEPYLAVKENANGRLWGVINRTMLPFAKISQMVIDYEEKWYREFQDMCRQIWNGIEDDCGFHLYTPNPYTITYFLSKLFVDKFKLQILSEAHETLRVLPCEYCPF